MRQWTIEDIRAASRRCSEAMRIAEPALNAADGRLGDGDTGQTMRRLAETVAGAADKIAGSETDAGAFLRKLGMAGMTATGSSLGTLVSVGLMEMGKYLSGKQAIAFDDLMLALEVAEAAMLARGSASLGDKTALDLLHAVRTRLADQTQRITMEDVAARAAVNASHAALEAFRGQPCRMGRARMFAERSIGADDPGMLAFANLTIALTGIGQPSAPMTAFQVGGTPR
ncbi:DAK2 domain-containing protein [Rhizobium lusitanum]|uniref:DAK2 domain-containing protein n=1 Tax=Rhizobium lusitanum TaxID=293958 RepID=A0A6L9UAF2_9HYPH|nr:dihydroxyacetone kinase subunit L [Rhizobium lusitanum]NEI72564.1 DAK2 domain-containing protein [Rhizobium lusitanum]